MDKITGSAVAHGVAVEVFPGGALASISLTQQAIRLGARDLADAILGAVTEATARANQRTRHALPGLGERELAMFGLDCSPEVAEQVEATTPQSWSVR